jgi:hypothetical protein
MQALEQRDLAEQSAMTFTLPDLCGQEERKNERKGKIFQGFSPQTVSTFQVATKSAERISCKAWR